MYKIHLVFLFLLFTTEIGHCETNDTVTSEDTTIISWLLHQSFPDEGYNDVTSETHFDVVDMNNPKEIAQGKEYLKKKLRKKGFTLDDLVDQLFERNEKSLQLAMKSSPTEGYIFESENGKEEDDWIKCYKEHHKYHGGITVSLPVYDAKSGFVLIYKSIHKGMLQASGWIFLIKSEGGQLKEVLRVMAWIS